MFLFRIKNTAVYGHINTVHDFLFGQMAIVYVQQNFCHV